MNLSELQDHESSKCELIMQANTMAMVILAAVWSILTGVFQIAVAILLRNRIEKRWLMVACGVAFVLFGLVFAFSPKAGIVVMAWIIGGYSILAGVVLMLFALQWKKIESLEATPKSLPEAC